MMEALVGTREAARILGKSAKTIGAWCRSPNPPLEFYLIEGEYKFSLSSIKAYLDSVRVPAGPRRVEA
jgi:hypothetical protein